MRARGDNKKRLTGGDNMNVRGENMVVKKIASSRARLYYSPLRARVLSSFTTGRGVAAVNGVRGCCRRRVDNVAIKPVLMFAL